MKKADQFFSRALPWCYHLLFFVTPLLFTWFNEELFEFNKMLFVYAMSLIIGGLWLGQMAMHRKFEWKRSVFDIPLLIFLISQVLSTVASIHPWTSVFGYYTRFNGGLLSTLAYMTLLIVFIQKIPTRKVWDFCKTLAISSILVSLIAVPEHFGHSFSCVLINSSHLNETLPLSKVLSPSQLVQSYNTKCWVQDVQSRVFATFGQPNWLAAFAVTLIPVFTILASVRKNQEQWIYGIASIGLMLDLIFSKSRSGTLGLFASLVWLGILAALWIRHRQINSPQPLPVVFSQISRSLRVSGVVIVGIILCALVFGTQYTPSVSELLRGTPKPVETTTQPANRLDEGGTSSAEIRKIVWTGAINVWKRYPVLGSGVETFAYSYYKDRPMEHNNVSEWDFLYNKAHNEFLNFLATTGLVGLVSYCVLLTALIGYPAYSALKQKDTSLEVAAVLFGVSAGLVALTVSNALGFSTVMVTVLMYLLPAMCWKLQHPEKPPVVVARPALSKRGQLLEAEDNSLNIMEWVWPAVIGFAVLLGLIAIWRTWRADYLFASGKNLNQSQQYADGVDSLETAYQLGGNEGIFAEELGETYSWLSAAFADANQASPAAIYRAAAKEKADEMIADNPHNLNFYKTKTRILATLAPQDPDLLNEAEETLIKASELAPTDPKVRYNLALIRLNQGDTDQAIADLEQTITMKPNYEEARMTLAKLYAIQSNPQKAIEQYRYVLDKIQPANTLAQSEIASIEAELATASSKPKPKR